MFEQGKPSIEVPQVDLEREVGRHGLAAIAPDISTTENQKSPSRGNCWSQSLTLFEPIIGHLKAEGHLGRCYLKGRAGDAANVVLSAAGHNFRRILAWLREFLCLFLVQLSRTFA